MSGDAVETEFLAWVAGREFTCLGARAAARRGVLRLVQPGRLAEPETTTKLHGAIRDFVQRDLSAEENFATMVAIFDGPSEIGEEEFDRCFWAQLQALHDLDAVSYPWASGVSADPQSPTFSFSLINHPFFVVGMHPQASRIARRFRLPAIAFNSHRQFDRLRAVGTYDRLKSQIRKREMALQQSLNVNLANFGEQSDARQYSGLPTTQNWTCPLTQRPAVSD